MRFAGMHRRAVFQNEVHHLKQVAYDGEEHLVDPIEDLRSVCANCHRMLHKVRPPPTPLFRCGTSFHAKKPGLVWHVAIGTSR
jgi:hypothetical protein